MFVSVCVFFAPVPHTLLFVVCAFWMRTMSEHHSCVDEIEALTKELEEYTLQANRLKQKYKNSLIENLQKDIQIRVLEQKVKSNKKLKFVELSAATKDKIELIGNSTREDSTFVNCVLFDLYNDDIETIKQKSLSGRSKDNVNVNSEISPTKKNTLEKLFKERLSYLPPQEVDEERKKKLNKLIRNAIDNAKKFK